MILKYLQFLVCITLVSTADICRKSVPLTQSLTCGPQQTKLNEGQCLCCYYDTKNIPTIGIGFNLQRKDAKEIMSNYNLSLASVLEDCVNKTTDHCLTKENAEQLFTSTSYPEFEKCAYSFAPNLPLVKQAAIIDLAFSVGCDKLFEFVKMQEALKKNDWKTAAEELKNSLWWTQVGINRRNSDYNCIANQSCTIQTCNGFTQSCSTNDVCFCFEKTNNTVVCLYPSISCPDSLDCTYSYILKSLIVGNECCVKPKCVPLSVECINLSMLR